MYPKYYSLLVIIVKRTVLFAMYDVNTTKTRVLFFNLPFNLIKIIYF